MMMEQDQTVGWDNQTHVLWLTGKQDEAIQQVLALINSHGEKKPRSALLQLCYYLFFLNDYPACIALLKNSLEHYPNDIEILTNLAVSLSRNGQYEEAIQYAEACALLDQGNYLLHDCLANSYYRIGRTAAASVAGTKSLTLKDRKHGQKPDDWALPEGPPEKFARQKKKVIAFSLWGDNPRYLNGALRNLLLAPDLCGGWELWFYADSSVPANYMALIQHLGGKILREQDNQSLKSKLCWRFKVANAEDVGCFLIRDADSVISVREWNAVQEWLETGQWFHVIRDWWTHTDLVLAGLWGGIAGVLPNIEEMLANYSSEHIETPNIDQWFLRDQLWRYIKTSCCVHDRCFTPENARPVPGPLPAGKTHIGCCEAIQRPGFQEKFLAPWLAFNPPMKPEEPPLPVIS